MRILDKLFKRNQVEEKGGEQVEEQQVAKKDIYIYVEMMDEPILREDKDYVIAGYYNEDMTKFKDLISGQTFDCKPTTRDAIIIIVNDKRYAVLCFNEYYSTKEQKNISILRTIDHDNFNYNPMRCAIDGVALKDKVAIQRYYSKQSHEGITAFELKSIAKEFNQHIYTMVNQTLSNNKQLKDLRSAGYNKF